MTKRSNPRKKRVAPAGGRVSDAEIQAALVRLDQIGTLAVRLGHELVALRAMLSDQRGK